jgi:UTP--glucose-1-phosphate uridylyltransferase
MKLTQAILPVAGFGTRFLPWTKVVPKELLPIGSTPIIALLVDECMSVGIRDISFVISRGKEAIPQFFYAQPELEHALKKRDKGHMLEELMKYNEVRFHVAYQEEMKGDGHAILQAADWVNSETIAILFGDDLITGEENGLQQLAKAWEDSGGKKETAVLCLQDVEKKLVHKYGIVDIEPTDHKSRLRKIRGLVEKPKPEDAPSTLGIVGKYIIPRSTLVTLETVESSHHDKEIRLIDALTSQLGTIDIFGYEIEGKRYDTGTPAGYREAVMDLGGEKK